MRLLIYFKYCMGDIPTKYEYNNFLLPHKLFLIQIFASRFHEMQLSNGAYKLFLFARKIWRWNCISDSLE